MANLLSPLQRESLQTFQEVSQITDEYVCIQILQQNAWDLDNALSQFLLSGQRQPTESSETVAAGTTPDDSSELNSNNNSASSGTSDRSISNQQIANSSRGNTSGFVGIILFLLKWLFQARPLALDPKRDALRFIDEYNRNLSTTHPTLFPNSYQAAVAQAHAQSKFLLVYLHSPLHDDTQRFCRNVLASEALLAMTNEHTITWAGSVWDPEAFGLATQLRASAFPFVALLVCQSNRSVQVALKIQGYVEENVLVERLQTTMHSFTSIIARQRQEAFQRQEGQRLREQQDREYREAQEADLLAAQQQEQLEREQAAAEEEARQRQELEEAVELSRRLTTESNLRKLREYFEQNPEPPVTSSSSDVATVRFQLPWGSKLSRRFKKSDTIQVLFDFLKLQFGEQHAAQLVNDADAALISNFSVSTHFPKVELTNTSQTVEEAGLYPRGMLYVQDLDA